MLFEYLASFISKNLEFGTAAHVEEEGTEGEIHQVPEDGIYKAVERIKLLNRRAPFQLLLFLQTTPGEKLSASCSPSFPYDVSSQGELELKCPMIKVLAWTQAAQRISGWMSIHVKIQWMGNDMV